MTSTPELCSRRRFLGCLAAGVAGVAMPGRLHGYLHEGPGGWIGAERIQPVGIQLYTLRALMSEDAPGTLSALAGIGYREVEFAGLAGRTHAQMRALLDERGLRAASSHNSLAEIRGDWESTLEGAAVLGQSYVVCPSIGGRDRTPDGLRTVADLFNRAGEAAARVGLRFGYHNHDWEFEEADGVRPYDLLLERCDPELVSMQLDLHWIVHAGVDPFEYIAAHPGRFHSVHAKDRTADGRMVNVGEGVIDFERVHALRETAGIRHWFVEHDRPDDPLADVTVSYRALAAIGAEGPP